MKERNWIKGETEQYEETEDKGDEEIDKRTEEETHKVIKKYEEGKGSGVGRST